MKTAFSSVNPADGRLIRGYRPHSPARVERVLRQAQAAAKAWRRTRPDGRGRMLRRAEAILRRRAGEFSRLITSEMGKPAAEARAEISKCADLCAYYASHAGDFLAPERSPGAPRAVSLVFEPLGTVLAIMPWNFPFWQAFRAAVPALLAGNTMLLKHAPNVTGCALAIEAVFRKAAKPRLLQTLLVGERDIPALIADRRIHGVTLTGSTAAGKKVAALAGAAMKKCVFELGGSDAYLILADADLDRAAELCAQSRLLNGGQSCISAKRFIVVAAIRREFERKFALRLAARRVGDPRAPGSDLGPMARADLRDHLDRQVRASLKAGARLVLGGRPVSGPGFYYPPTLLVDVRPGQPAHDEELFGPVAALISVRDEAAAISTANNSIYGLGAAVFSRDRRRALRVAAQLEAGTVFINDFVRSDPAVPFGGIKQSGHGRELGLYGMREFANIKAIRR